MRALYYNDAEGARAMTHADDYRTMGTSRVDVGDVGITVTLQDEYGASLPAYAAFGRTYAIGEAGRRYTLSVTNHTNERLEVVASIDGLDVLDGHAASFAKRGYILPANGSLDIEGFRRSDDQVAAFRFGSVRNSYAARTGNDRNVGVIGIAAFRERSERPRPRWTQNEIDRRRTADPFPNGYAAPPPALPAPPAWGSR